MLFLEKPVLMKNNFSLDNKIALVTGANGLIGNQHCIALAEAGATVIACDINLPKKDELKKTFKNIFCLAFDVTNKNEIIKAKDIVVNKYGSIDILVNNAAINDMFENPELAADYSKFENYPLESWKASLNVNITGVFLCSQVFGTEMAKQGFGSIINVASTYGMVGPDQSIYRDDNDKQMFYKGPSYPTTKGAVINFTRYLAAYWGKKGVRVNTLSPGGVLNGQNQTFINKYSRKTLLGRMASVNDYKGAVVFLASDASAYMTGSNLVVDGGWTAI